jgi:fermentation-respiration switch protein FrsA (DUF1100 family)
VEFPNREIKLAGNLYFPANFDKSKKYAAIIVGHPAGGVKEQTAGLYSQKLAEKGFVALAFDAAYQGASGGEPRGLDDPAIRVEDFRAAADFMSNYASIDPNRIGGLAICGGVGFMLNAAQTDHRFKAVAGISGVDLGRLRREGLNGSLSLENSLKRLDELAKQRTIEAAGGELRYNNFVPASEADIPADAPAMYREGWEYYRTARAQHPNSDNKYLFTSLDKLIPFTAFDHLDWISPRPLLLIAGSKADSKYFSDDAMKLAKEPKELFKVEGASHIDLYDKPEYVRPIVDKLTDFYGKNLK